MTIEERAKRIASWLDRADAPAAVIAMLKTRAEKEIEEAVAEERRTNAQIARDYDQRWNAATCDAIAAAIMSHDVFTEQT